MGPAFAADLFMQEHPADSYKAILYGSLSKTGKGHGTAVPPASETISEPAATSHGESPAS